MAHAVAVTWVAREGEEEHVRALLEEIAPQVRAEPGCLMYIAHRSAEDPRTFFLYEQYIDEAAYQAHRETEHFQELVLGEAVPLLESRIPVHFETIE
jgi:(4S)-4-hydroxy-5-phosphonooxypentane-2,3-dione isomerase